MAFGDLVRHREIGSNTIIKEYIDEYVKIMPILLKVITFVKFSRENYKRVIDMKTLIANALWEIIKRIIINP